MKYNPPKNSLPYQEGIMANISWFQIILIIIFPVVLIVFLMIVYKFIKKAILKNKHYNHSVFLIRLPKEKPQD